MLKPQYRNIWRTGAMGINKQLDAYSISIPRQNRNKSQCRHGLWIIRYMKLKIICFTCKFLRHPSVRFSLSRFPPNTYFDHRSKWQDIVAPRLQIINKNLKYIFRIIYKFNYITQILIILLNYL